MNVFPKLNRGLLKYQHISRTIPYLAPLVAISGTLLTYLLDLEAFTVVSLYATVPIVIASVAYFATYKSGSAVDTLARPLSTAGLKSSIIFYLVFHAIAILLVVSSDVRPLLYYVMISLTVTVILYQILMSELTTAHVVLVLTETTVLLMSIFWSVTLKYDYFFGRTDVFPHHFFVNSLLSTNYVSGAFGEYQAFPLWHIHVAFQNMLYDGVVDPLTIFYVTTGFVFALTTAAVYILATRFLFSQRTALAAALALCLNPFVLLYGMYSLPRSITSFLFVLVLLVLFFDDAKGAVLFVGLITGIAMFHTVSLPFIFAILACHYAVERLMALARESGSVSRYSLIPTWKLLAIPVVQFAYWAIADPRLISRIVNLLAENSFTGGSDPVGGLTAQFIEQPFNELVNYLPFSFIIFFVLFAVIQSPKVSRFSQRQQHVLITTLVLVTVSVPGPALLINLVSDVTPDMVFRFGHYTFPFIAIAVGVGIVSILKTRWPVGGPSLKTAVVVLLVLSAGFVTVSNDFVASDNPLVERDDFYTFYISESEIDSFNTITAHSTTAVTGDYITCRYVDNPGEGSCEIIQADPVDEVLHFPDDSVLVLRKGELEKRPLSIYPTPEPVADPPYSNNRESLGKESAVWNSLVEQNRIYDSSEVTGYVSE